MWQWAEEIQRKFSERIIKMYLYVWIWFIQGCKVQCQWTNKCNTTLFYTHSHSNTNITHWHTHPHIILYSKWGNGNGMEKFQKKIINKWNRKKRKIGKKCIFHPSTQKMKRR